MREHSFGAEPLQYQPMFVAPIPPRSAASLIEHPPVYECHYLHDAGLADNSQEMQGALERWTTDDLEELKIALQAGSEAAQVSDAVGRLSTQKEGVTRGFVNGMDAQECFRTSAAKTESDHLKYGFRDWVRTQGHH